MWSFFLHIYRYLYIYDVTTVCVVLSVCSCVCVCVCKLRAPEYIYYRLYRMRGDYWYGSKLAASLDPCDRREPPNGLSECSAHFSDILASAVHRHTNKLIAVRHNSTLSLMVRTWHSSTSKGRRSHTLFKLELVYMPVVFLQIYISLSLCSYRLLTQTGMVKTKQFVLPKKSFFDLVCRLLVCNQPMLSTMNHELVLNIDWYWTISSVWSKITNQQTANQIKKLYLNNTNQSTNVWRQARETNNRRKK